MLTLKLPSKMGKNIQKESKTLVFDSFLTESVISVNVDGSPSRVCKERSDGIAIVRTFQPPLHLSKPQVRNRITYDPSEEKACDGQKKRHHLT